MNPTPWQPSLVPAFLTETETNGNIMKTFLWGLGMNSSRGGAGGAMRFLVMRSHSGSNEGTYYSAYYTYGSSIRMMNASVY